MAFESLSDKLTSALKKITGKGKLTESNMEEMLREVRMSLLEADVNYGVVKQFISNIREKALGQEVLKALNPSEMVVTIVREELIRLLGEEDAALHLQPGLTSIMIAGLQGTGKTTASAKIARFLKQKKNRKVLLAACDVVRPAAIEQLKTLGQSIGVDVFSLGAEVSALETAVQARNHALKNGYDVVIYDTAGRLHIDEALMEELEQIEESVAPQDILLTVDAMTGQDIVTVAREFSQRLNLTGLIVTKTDGDARGGGLLSVRSITSVPVMFVSSGEKVTDLQEFHPDRMADRILGMGDLASLMEKAQDSLDEKVSKRSMDRLMAGQFTFNDMLDQFDQMSRLDSFSGMMKMIPGLNKLAGKIDDEALNETVKKGRAIIQSMTPYEREHPNCLKASRKKRIALGSGTKVADVNKLISQVSQMSDLSKVMSGGRMPAGFGGMGGMGGFGGMGGMGSGGRMVSRHSGSKKPKKAKKKKK